MSAYDIAKAAKATLEAAAMEHSKKLNAVPGVGSGPAGMTPDHIKQSPEYREHRSNYEAAHKALRNYNQQFNKQFKKEYEAERIAKRAKLQSEHELPHWKN